VLTPERIRLSYQKGTQRVQEVHEVQKVQGSRFRVLLGEK